MTDEDLLDQQRRVFRPVLKQACDALVQMARTLDHAAGKMELREQQGEAREQRMVDAVTRLEARLAALEPARPKTEEARDELGQESARLGTGVLRWIRLLPSRLVAGLAYARENPGKTALMLGGAATGARLLSGWIPGLAPIADLLESLMARTSPVVEVPS